MNRRILLRNAFILSAGVTFLPACLQDEKSALPLKSLPLTTAQEKMLAALCDAIIPATNHFIGAKDLKAHEFVLIMMDDCNSPEDQQKFLIGIKAFDTLSHDKFGQTFPSYTAQQKKSLLTDLENKKDISPDALFFYDMAKRYTLQCFTVSKEYMTGVKKYNMVPGPDFKGCLPQTVQVA